MALINCPECTNKISDTAEKCIHCGYRINATTIELTSKKYKVWTIFGFVVCVIGGGILYDGLRSGTSDYSNNWGAMFIVAGMAIILVVRILVWWNHK